MQGQITNYGVVGVFTNGGQGSVVPSFCISGTRANAVHACPNFMRRNCGVLYAGVPVILHPAFTGGQATCKPVSSERPVGNERTKGTSSSDLFLGLVRWDGVDSLGADDARCGLASDGWLGSKQFSIDLIWRWRVVCCVPELEMQERSRDAGVSIQGPGLRERAVIDAWPLQNPLFWSPPRSRFRAFALSSKGAPEKNCCFADFLQTSWRRFLDGSRHGSVLAVSRYGMAHVEKCTTGVLQAMPLHIGRLAVMKVSIQALPIRRPRLLWDLQGLSIVASPSWPRASAQLGAGHDVHQHLLGVLHVNDSGSYICMSCRCATAGGHSLQSACCVSLYHLHTIAVASRRNDC